MYDTTAGYIETPLGYGKFIRYDSVNKVVYVEMGHEYEVAFDANEVYVGVE